jgi:hypothetical protein
MQGLSREHGSATSSSTTRHVSACTRAANRMFLIIYVFAGVFELLKFEGLSHREVAETMGLSEKTVENHLTRALARNRNLRSGSKRGR